MKEIPVWTLGTIGAWALVDDEDYARLNRGPRWHLHMHGYATRTVGRKRIRQYLHRLVLDYRGDKSVDHINRNPLDNRKKNLRLIPQKWNAWANLQRAESRLTALQQHLSQFPGG